MRRSFFLIIGLLFLGTTLVELGVLAVRLNPPRRGAATSIPVESMVIPTTSPTPLSPFAPGNTVQHRAVEGEWLLQIARCYGASYQEVREANPQIDDPEQSLKGMTVTVPHIGSVGGIYGPPCVQFHTVQTGDTWQFIAQKYNADLEVLRHANPVSLQVGQVVKIPLNSSGIERPLCASPIPIRIPSGDNSITLQGSIPPNQNACFKIETITGEAVSIQAGSTDRPVRMSITESDETVIKPAYDNEPSWIGSSTLLAGSNILLFSEVVERVVQYTLELTALPAIPTVPVSIGPTLAMPIRLEADWPARMEVDTSDFLRVSLIPMREGVYRPYIENGENSSVAATAIVVEPPGAVVGTEYEAYVVADLIAGFSVIPPKSLEQPLEGQPITWEWIIKSTGTEEVAKITVEIVWRTKDEKEQTFTDLLWEEHLRIKFFKPWLTIGTLSIMAVVTAFLGSLFSVPFLYQLILTRKKDADSRRKKEPPPD